MTEVLNYDLNAGDLGFQTVSGTDLTFNELQYPLLYGVIERFWANVSLKTLRSACIQRKTLKAVTGA